MAVRDVVVAAATPWGRSALAVVRLSGEGLDEVLMHFVEPFRRGAFGADFMHRARPLRVRFRDAEGVFDDGVAIFGRAPRTYTGEPTAELTCHGNPLIVQRLLHAAVDAGARMAGPGEFTRRALEHGKLDVLRAEAVMQVTSATSPQGLRIGRDGLEGKLGAAMHALRPTLLTAAAELEARLDYPGDELTYLEDLELLGRLAVTMSEARALAETWRAGNHLVHGARVALVGAVNAGKSSLFNALMGRKRALVHATPGTTRDVLEVVTTLDGLTVTLLDTAGERQTSDPVEAAGLALARELVEEADLLVVVLRARAHGPSLAEQAILERTAHQARIVVYNGVDRPDVAEPPQGAVCTVATDGVGLPALRQAMRVALVGEDPGGARLVVASVRQRDLLLSLAEAVEEAITSLPVAGVAVAADAVTRALEELDALTGADTREDVLDALFSKFCIGK